jgi:hypothetical protein
MTCPKPSRRWSGRRNAMLKTSISLFICLSVLNPGLFADQSEAYELPDAVKITLKRLEETYHVLDAVSQDIWPGWTNYREFPFLFNFENGLRVLVGHPYPPADFTELPATKVSGKSVYVDRSKLEPMELAQPLSGGGGILPYGQTESGDRISVVSITLARRMPGKEGPDEQFRTENQIILYIHELFHCFQEDHVRIAAGNLRYNPDADFALYSEIEGKALREAYKHQDPAKSQEFIKDFLTARELKRKSMTDLQRRQESSDDVREGTAVYSERRALELIEAGYTAKLTSAEDPFYHGFKEMEKLGARYKKRMQGSIDQVYDPKMKCYDYGGFQALLLQRHFPGWQEPFAKEPRFLDEELEKRIPLTPVDKEKVMKRFDTQYGLAEIKTRVDDLIAGRDAAYAKYKTQQGKAYIISFKEIREFISSRVSDEEELPKLGLIYFYPEGLKSFEADDISFECGPDPAVIDQLYYIRYVDSDWKERENPVHVEYKRRDPDGTLHEATVKTPFFTLRAPKIRIKDTDKRYKIWILARVKEQ